MDVIRRQATLFFRNQPTIDAVRREFNPVQASLIDAHVTLCREDEVSDWGEIARKLAAKPAQVTLRFGDPKRDGDLLLMPCTGSTSDFDRLRSFLLDTASYKARKHEPHITLIHPRNGKCTDEIFERVSQLLTPFSYTFSDVSLIEQRNGGVWNILDRFSLEAAQWSK